MARDCWRGQNALAGAGSFVTLPELLLLWTPSKTFEFVLPWLLLIATLTLAFGRQFGEWLRRRWRIRPSAVLFVQLALGIYGGYFGGAVGIMMMAVWGLMDNRDFKSLNAPGTLLVTGAVAGDSRRHSVHRGRYYSGVFCPGVPQGGTLVTTGQQEITLNSRCPDSIQSRDSLRHA